MENFIALMKIDDWEAMKVELNERKKFSRIEELVHDMPEVFRLEALRQIDGSGRNIDPLLEEMQKQSYMNDPRDLYPLVATAWQLNALPPEMTTCIVCGGRYKRGENIIKKGCGRHTLHQFCLLGHLRAGCNPIYGPCRCSGQEYREETWHRVAAQTVHVQPIPKPIPKRYPKTPDPRNLKFGAVGESVPMLSSQPTPSDSSDVTESSSEDPSDDEDDVRSAVSWGSASTFTVNERAMEFNHPRLDDVYY